MNYKEYLRSSTIAKVTLALLVIEVLAAIYIVTQAARYMGGSVAIIGIIATLIAGGLLWLCHYKKAVPALVLEIILAVVLVVGLIAVGKINTVAGEISRTVEYETVQIVALKDSPIEPEDPFDEYVLGYTNSDDGALREIKRDSGGKQQRSKAEQAV